MAVWTLDIKNEDGERNGAQRGVSLPNRRSEGGRSEKKKKKKKKGKERTSTEKKNEENKSRE